MLFQEETDEIDPDVLIDAANEVWDFMIDLLSEDDEQ
jgi:hypothetical protein